MEPVPLAVWIALAAAFLLAAAAVLQHRAAVTAGRGRTRARLLAALLRHPVWAAGIFLLVAGNALQAVALGTGRLLVVEPVAVTSLLFGLPLSALLWRHRLRWRDWGAAAVVAGGVWAFLVLGHAHGGTNTAPTGRWLMAGGVVVGVALVAVGASRPYASLRPTGLALAAGMALGLSDGLTRTTAPLIVHHRLHAFASWQPYALVAAALGGYLLLQFAYRQGHLAQCLPAAVLAQPVTGAVVGVAVLGEHLEDGLAVQAGQGLSVLAAVLAVIVLARSPRVLAFAADVRHGPARR